MAVLQATISKEALRRMTQQERETEIRKIAVNNIVTMSKSLKIAFFCIY